MSQTAKRENLPGHWIYYFKVGQGVWVGDFSFKITSWKGFWAHKTSIKNKIFTLLIVVTQKITGHFKIHSVLEAYPEYSDFGVATNVIRIIKMGITIYKMEEHYVLDKDGSNVYVQSMERLGPIPFLFKIRKRHPAKVAPDGSSAVYIDMPILGVNWTGTYQVLDDSSIDASLVCEFAEASEIISKQEAGVEIDFHEALDKIRQDSITTISDVIRKLGYYRNFYSKVKDRRVVFTHAYFVITKDFEQKISKTPFHDPNWIIHLDVEFAKQYFSSLEAYDHGIAQESAWSLVFEEFYKGRTSVIEELVLGMSAHIIQDLPLALEVASKAGDKAVADFHMANDILQGGINTIQKSTARLFNPMLGWLDSLAGKKDEIFTNYGIRMSRGLAWYNKDRMAVEEDRKVVFQSLIKSTKIVINSVSNPSAWSSRFLIRLFRIISNTMRRWPTKFPD